MNSLSLRIPPRDEQGSGVGDRLRQDGRCPHSPELGNRGLGGALVGGLLTGNLTLPYHRHSLNTRAQILATFEQLAQTLIRPMEENQT